MSEYISKKIDDSQTESEKKNYITKKKKYITKKEKKLLAGIKKENIT